MNIKKNSTPLRTALIYAFFGILWILASDITLELGNPTVPAGYHFTQSIKGSLFVLVSAGLIYLFLLREIKSLRETEDRYQLLFQASLDAVLLTEPDGSIHAANPTACRMFGKTEEEIKQGGRGGVVDLSDPRLKLALEERAHSGHFFGELTFLRKGGEKFPGEISTSLFKDKDGRDRTSMIIRDISERKLAEKAMQESEERFSKIFDASPFAMNLFSLSDNISTLANEAFLTLIGYSRDELIGHSAAELNLFTDLAIRAAWVKELSEAGSTKLQNIQIRKKSGEIRDASAAIENIEVGGQKMGLVMAMDITERKQAENELRESEFNLKRSQTVAHVGDWSWDTQSNQVTWSDEMHRIFGIDPEAFNGDLNDIVAKSIHPDDREKVAHSNESVINEQAPATLEYRVVWPDNSVHTVLAIPGERFTDEKGNILRLTGVVQDITERKQAENELRENNSRLELAMQSANMAWWEMDITKGNVKFDKRKTDMLGYPPENFKHYNDFMALVHPEDSDKAMDAMQRHIDGLADKYEVEYRILTKSDGYKWFYDIGAIIKKDSKGIPLYAAGLVIDITERKEAEEALHKSETRYRQLVEGAPDVVYTFSNKRGGIYYSPRVEQVLGYSAEYLQAHPHLWNESIHPEDRARINETIHEFEAGKFFDVEYRIQDAQGNWRWLMDRSIGRNIGGDEMLVEGMATDITERKQAEKQVQVQLQRVSALREIDRAISSSLDMRLSLDVVLSQTISQLGVDAASLLLLNPSSQILEYFTGKGFRTLNIRQSRTQIGEGLAGRAGLERKLLHIPDLAKLDSQFQRRELLKDEKFVEYFGVPLIAKGVLKGVLEIFNRTPLNPDLEWINYLETLGGQAAIAIDNVQMFEGVQQSNFELVTAYDATITGWSRAMDLRDKETEGHTLRVTELTVQMARKMGISQQEIVQMRRGALLHDIGKLGVPDNILLKPDKLSTFEWAIMRQHPSYAYKMLLPITYLRPALDIPYCHHEKWDGTGYPRGLQGEEIPMAARIFAIIDVWDALRSDRPYRASWTVEKIREHIIEGSGTHFDPQVVEAFIRLLDEFPDLR